MKNLHQVGQLLQMSMIIDIVRRKNMNIVASSELCVLAKEHRAGMALSMTAQNTYDLSGQPSCTSLQPIAAGSLKTEYSSNNAHNS